MVDANDSNTYGLISAKLELRSLIAKVINHAVDLLYHCFGKNLYFCADFNCCYLCAPYRESRSKNGGFAGDDFSEGAIATSCVYASAAIGKVDNPFPVPDTRDQFRRTINRNKVLIQL